MDSFGSLLSPIDNFASFSHFTSATNNSDSCGKPGSQSPTPALPHTPPNKSTNDWHDLLDGPQLGQFPFSLWDTNPFSQTTQVPASPWRPNIFRSLSDSFADSPASSSSFLSSTTCSPSLLSSSTTCSPWETCPGLAPASPEPLPGLDDLSAQYPNALHFSTVDDSSVHAFNGLSLGSPMRSPVRLPFFPESDSVGAIDPNALVNNQGPPAGIDTTNPCLMSNALALDLATETHAGSSFAGPSQLRNSHSLPRLGSPFHTKSPSPLTEAPSSAHSVPHTEISALPHSAGFPSESDSFLRNRVFRRKTSRIDYAEEGYDGDSDDDEDYAGEESDVPRVSKRRKAGVAFVNDSDEDLSLSEDGHGRRPGARGRKPRGKGANGNAKRKCKRRHQCPKDGCGSSFTRVTDMERHIASVHRNADTDANRCAFCRKAFSREDAVLRHENDSCPMRPKKNAAAKIDSERWS
ncbi:hypothetical protein DFH11DRAFT_725630 [Phellopilus nigrolimitatus]|nr:hypothetical protein DFH11DRAFT_725630 [Phellopilus nigrolimitatus]